jgi:3-methyladenine DNA glycosylase/8-oxoguanine DNA glycosylase
VDGTFGDVVVADALRELSTRDPKLGELINRHGTLPRIFACQDSRRATHEPNRAFRSLARAIVFQQLNGTAAATIFGRVLRCVGAEDDPAFSLTPDAIIDADEAQMRACGLSQRKYEYLVSLASAFHPSHSDYPLTDESLEAMDDEETMSSLVALRGVGPWSVHMFQMFYLNRPDVLPTKDFGVRKGVMRLYGLKDMPSEAKVEEIAESWKPHRTLASMYMWQAADEGKSSGQMQATHDEGEREREGDDDGYLVGGDEKGEEEGDSGRRVVSS